MLMFWFFGTKKNQSDLPTPISDWASRYLVYDVFKVFIDLSNVDDKIHFTCSTIASLASIPTMLWNSPNRFPVLSKIAGSNIHVTLILFAWHLFKMIHKAQKSFHKKLYQLIFLYFDFTCLMPVPEPTSAAW